MKANARHHYRVVQRDKSAEAEKVQLEKIVTTKVTLLTALMFCTSVVLSFALGYLLGSDK
jgi:hypothetical protein